MNAKDDILTFSEEVLPSDRAGPLAKAPLFVLVVDDEPMMHAVTAMVLDGLLCDRRPVMLLHAYSASEARQILSERGDVALILLDVVMETDSAGLDLVEDVRDKLLNRDVRIVLRTGQPGRGFDSVYLQRYDISAYCVKTELTRQQLTATVFDALLAYSHLSGLEVEGRPERAGAGGEIGKLPVTG